MKISAPSYFYCWFLSPVTLTLNKIGCCNATQSSVTHIGSHLPSFLCTSSLGFASYCWVKFHSTLDYNLYRRNDFSLLSLSYSFSLSLSSILNLPSKAWEWFWLQRDISPPIRGSHRANAELAFPFMLCPWDYHINLRDLITRLRLAAGALDQAIPPLLPSN